MDENQEQIGYLGGVRVQEGSRKLSSRLSPLLDALSGSVVQAAQDGLACGVPSSSWTNEILLHV